MYNKLQWIETNIIISIPNWVAFSFIAALTQQSGFLAGRWCLDSLGLHGFRQTDFGNIDNGYVVSSHLHSYSYEPFYIQEYIIKYFQLEACLCRN